MSVYYVRAPSSGLVKIGFAKDALRRFSKIQSDSADALVLFAVEDGDFETERGRHAQFAAYRVRGEWFRDEGILRDHIDRLPRFLRPTPKVAGSGPLGKWIAKKGMTLGEFAALVGTSQGTISRICRGQHFPRRDLLLAIVNATDWAVDANALAGLTPPSPCEAA